MKIDYVVPYVDSSKQQWINLYNKYKNDFLGDKKEFQKRFDTNPLFKYSFRGIEKFMPWINNVFLIVQDYDQIPDFINREKVKIILHEQFIPKQFLPTFNANTIEMFLHNIKELSNLFIYGNDDTYIFNDCKISDFFIDACPRNNIRFVKSENDTYSRMMINLNNSVWKKIYNRNFYSNSGYFTTFHVQQPYSKLINKKIFDEFADDILKNLSHFRNEKQFTQVLFSLYFYEITHGKFSNPSLSSKYFNLSLYADKVKKEIHNIKEQLICLNNGDVNSNSSLMPELEKIFDDKSIYEI